MLAAVTRFAVLPIVSLTYIESAGEFRRIEWSIPPSYVAIPVVASTAESRGGPGPVVSAASGAHARPLPRQPGPSGLHQTPS